MLWALIILFGDKNTENFFPIHWDFYLQRRWGLVLLHVPLWYLSSYCRPARWSGRPSLGRREMSLLWLKVTTRDRLPVPWVLHVYNLVLVNSYTQCWVTSWGLVFSCWNTKLAISTSSYIPCHAITLSCNCRTLPATHGPAALLLWLYMMALHHSIFRIVPKSTVV